MLLSTINISHCGRWHKIRLIFNAISCCNFGTISAGTWPNSSNMLVLKCCGCVHQIASLQLQLGHFNQTAAISSTTKLLTKSGAAAGNEQLPKPSSSRPININENQQQTQNNPEMTEDEQQLKQQQTQTDKPQHVKLAKASIAIGPNRNIEIECHQGTRGHRFIKINRLSNIPVPRDAYKFVAALDRLIGQLPVEKPTNSEEDIGSQRVLAFQKLEIGVYYDFHLSIVWHPKDNQWHLRIRSVQKSEKHKEREVHFPLWALPQLRQQMATMLVEYDGTERIDEMPTIPEWATREKAEEGDTEKNEENGQTELGQNESGVPQQQIDETEMDQPKVVKLAKSFLPLGPTRKLHIECEQGRSGHKTIKIYIRSEQPLKLPRTIYVNLPKIPVPEVAYTFVAAMDRLIGQLPVNAPAKPPAADESSQILANQIVEGGIFYDFQLSVVWFERGRRWDLKIRSVKTVTEHNEGGVQMALWTLPFLRQEIATMLEKFDGTQRIDEMPTIPEWATQAPSIQLRIDKMPPMPEWAKQSPNIRLKSRYSN